MEFHFDFGDDSIKVIDSFGDPPVQYELDDEWDQDSAE